MLPTHVGLCCRCGGPRVPHRHARGCRLRVPQLPMAVHRSRDDDGYGARRGRLPTHVHPPTSVRRSNDDASHCTRRHPPVTYAHPPTTGHRPSNDDGRTHRGRPVTRGHPSTTVRPSNDDASQGAHRHHPGTHDDHPQITVCHSSGGPSHETRRRRPTSTCAATPRVDGRYDCQASSDCRGSKGYSVYHGCHVCCGFQASSALSGCHSCSDSLGRPIGGGCVM